MEEPRTVPPPGTADAPAEQPRWRQDFPIDRPQDSYVARRDFTKFMVLISGAFFVGQLWIALQNIFRRQRGEPPVRKVASTGAIPLGGAMLFDYPTAHDPCVLIRTPDDQYLAYSNQCTHLMCAVRPQVAEQRLHCPCHVGYFDLETGRPLAGPPRRPLPRILLDVRSDAIYATGVEVVAAR